MTRIAFYSLGCKSNQYETDLMKDICSLSGFEIVPFHEPSDIYVINTCTVTGNADRKSRNAIRSAKKKNSSSVVIVTGCYADSDRDGLIRSTQPDIVLKNSDKKNILKFLPKANGASKSIKRMVRENIMIENGCENFCSYCIVPFVRGNISRKPADMVIEEAKELVDNGVKEVILTGINLGEYGQASLPRLIKRLSAIDGLLRIRLSSIEPMYVNEDLIKAISDNPKVCRHLHIPMQSGDDGILRVMNRTYTSKDFARIIDMARKHVKDIGITTDIIVGFPGEDDRAFNNTHKLADKLKFSRMHVFSYSDRPGTASFHMKNKVEPEIISARYDKMLELRAKNMLLFHRSQGKKPQEVLVERKDPKTGLFEGLTGSYIRVFFMGDELGDDCIGTLVPSKFKEFSSEHVFASPVLL